MATFEFRNAQEVDRIFKEHHVKYLFFGKSRAILLGYSDTTQDVGIDDILGSKQAANRQKDREAVPRLLSFTEWLRRSSK